VIGVVGKYFTLALIIAPLVGLIIGPYRGALAASIGGLIGWSIAPQYGLLFQFSFVPSTTTVLCSGSLYKGKWKTSVAVYIVLFLAFAFYPSVGPIWLYPIYLWFQLLGLIALMLQPLILRVKALKKHSSTLELGFTIGAISFVATLLGHIVGGLIFETIYYPALISSVDSWRTIWQSVVFVYPVERSIVVFVSVLVGVPLIKALKAHGFFIGGK